MTTDEMKRNVAKALTELSDRALVELAAARLSNAANGAVQEPGRDRWVHGLTKGSGSPVVVDDVDRPTALLEVWAPKYEGIHRYLVLWGSPAVALHVSRWLEKVWQFWHFVSATEQKEATELAKVLLNVEGDQAVAA